MAFSKTYGKSSFFFPSFFSFRTLHQYLWSKLAKSCFSKHFYRSLESSWEQALRYARSRLWLRTVNVSITCRVWHHDASNSSNGLPVISGSHATHWNNEKFLAEPRPKGFSLKTWEGWEKANFLGKRPGDEPWQGPSATSPFFLFFNISSFFDSLLSLYNKVAMEPWKYQWLKRLSSHEFV